MSEMESTGQAFEEMQEQNIRLLQQLREKDDANFKLMAEVPLRKHRKVTKLVLILIGFLYVFSELSTTRFRS